MRIAKSLGIALFAFAAGVPGARAAAGKHVSLAAEV